MALLLESGAVSYDAHTNSKAGWLPNARKHDRYECLVDPDPIILQAFVGLLEKAKAVF